jgi:hypothetical protein
MSARRLRAAALQQNETGNPPSCFLAESTYKPSKLGAEHSGQLTKAVAIDVNNQLQPV